jgi:regulatory protein
MKVTAIKQQVKRSDRYSIYVDGKYSFSLSEAGLLSTGLAAGRELSTEELAELKDTAVIDKGYGQALNLISHRPRSAWELQDYLRRKDYDEATQTVILERLTERGYIDDEEFARRWVANRRLLKSTSKRRLQQELRQKRVADDIIKKVLDEDETDEFEVLRELIAKKRAMTKYQDQQKLMQFLARQGFSYDQIKTALIED